MVTRSICGHATEAMQRRYSTVSGSEQADGLARVIRLFDGPSPLPPTPSGEGSGEGAQTVQTVDEEVCAEPSSPDLSKLA